MTNTFRTPDLNAPRFRPKRSVMLNKKLFLKFKDKYPEHKDLTLAEFKLIVRTFNEKLGEGMIDNRDGVELPEGLGYLFMGSCPLAKNKNNVNMKASKDLGFSAVHKNWESDNLLMKIFYTNCTSKYPFQNRQVWSLKAIKPLRVKASIAYKEDWPKYIAIDPTEKISAMFDKARKKEFGMKYISQVPEGYNEFEI
tara:strand:- start:521 stop:1108 length:588 start_codon:yes stop_codon:yes gene_type:complete